LPEQLRELKRKMLKSKIIKFKYPHELVYSPDPHTPTCRTLGNNPRLAGSNPGVLFLSSLFVSFCLFLLLLLLFFARPPSAECAEVGGGGAVGYQKKKSFWRSLFLGIKKLPRARGARRDGRGFLFGADWWRKFDAGLPGG
jgi:hypothetical protein